ncbi:MAG TPA: hypothetical protein VEV87_03975, partial [Chitinophagaceae bacterium]|nr:hypothetical protein [Chitinophagaceae bacterium]
MDLPIYVPFIIVASIVGFFVERKTGLPAYLKWLPYFLLLTSIVELFAWQMILRGKRTAPYYNFTTVISFVYFFYILYQLLRAAWVKRVIVICMIGYPLVAFANIFFLQGWNDFNTMTY